AVSSSAGPASSTGALSLQLGGRLAPGNQDGAIRRQLPAGRIHLHRAHLAHLH
ncbi:hypothetical protein M9458_054714, partial [Cirrhinus mrigala]